MMYSADMGSDVMTYVHINFLRDWFRHSKFGGGIDRKTHRHTQRNGNRTKLIL
jgi:hypothetical protein